MDHVLKAEGGKYLDVCTLWHRVIGTVDADTGQTIFHPGYDPDHKAPALAKQKRKRRHDVIAITAKALKAGLPVLSVTATDDAVTLTLNTDERPTVKVGAIETADELRRLM